MLSYLGSALGGLTSGFAKAADGVKDAVLGVVPGGLLGVVATAGIVFGVNRVTNGAFMEGITKLIDKLLPESAKNAFNTVSGWAKSIPGLAKRGRELASEITETVSNIGEMLGLGEKDPVAVTVSPNDPAP